MTDPHLLTDFGALSIIETYFYYDFPRDFAAVSTSGQLFIVIWNGPTEEDGHNWLLLPVTRGRLETARRGDLELRDAFLESESGIVYKLRTGTPYEPIVGVDPHTLPETSLPPVGERLQESLPLPLIVIPPIHVTFEEAAE